MHSTIVVGQLHILTRFRDKKLWDIGLRANAAVTDVEVLNPHAPNRWGGTVKRRIHDRDPVVLDTGRGYTFRATRYTCNKDRHRA